VGSGDCSSDHGAWDHSELAVIEILLIVLNKDVFKPALSLTSTSIILLPTSKALLPTLQSLIPCTLSRTPCPLQPRPLPPLCQPSAFPSCLPPISTPGSKPHRSRSCGCRFFSHPFFLSTLVVLLLLLLPGDVEMNLHPGDTVACVCGADTNDI